MPSISVKRGNRICVASRESACLPELPLSGSRSAPPCWTVTDQRTERARYRLTTRFVHLRAHWPPLADDSLWSNPGGHERLLPAREAFGVEARSSDSFLKHPTAAEGRPLPTAGVGCPVAQPVGQLSGDQLARATGSGRSAVSIVMPCSYNSATRQVAALAGSPAWPARRERATASTVRPAAPQACGEPAPRQ